MFGRSKEMVEFRELADKRGEMLHKYSDMVRALTKTHGPNELPHTGIIDPAMAELVLRRVLSAGIQQKAEKVPGTDRRLLESNVSRIEVVGPLTVTVKKGDTPGLTISCNDKEYISKVTTEVHGNTVRIGLKPMSFVYGGNVINVGTMNFGGPGFVSGRSASIHGSNNTITSGNGVDHSLPELDFQIEVVLPNVSDLEIEGSGDIVFLDAYETSLSVNVAGSGTILLCGKVDLLNASITGSGNVCAIELKAQNAKLHVTGSGDIEANVVDSVDARVTGSGDITVYGNPVTRNSKVTGSGDIDFI